MRVVITGAGGFVGRSLVALLGASHELRLTDSRLGDLSGIEGDLCDPATRAALFAGGCDALIHLATVPGGAAELDPVRAKAVNIDATMALIDDAAAAGDCPRVIFASSIAVFGDPLPALVDDSTTIAPRLLYGAHKAMMEEWLATQGRRGAISPLSLRLPGIVARPRAPSGMKSAFMSDLFHALRAHEAIALPVSPDATMWLMSVARLARNLAQALASEAKGTLTLPALHIRMADLVATIAAATQAPLSLVSHAPDSAIEAAFGRQPPLATPAAEALGFAADDDPAALVASALATLA